MSLPTQQDYLANLQPVRSRPDDSHCPICLEEWNYPEQEVVQASPECVRHPYHKECLVTFLTTETGNGSANTCPSCRRKLYMKVRRQITTEELYYDYFHSFNPALWRWLRSSTTRSTLQTLLHRPTNLPQGLTSEGRNMIATFCARRPEQAGLFDRLAALTDHLFGDVFMQLIQMALTHFHRAAMPSTLIPVLMTMGDGPTPFMIAALIADDFLEECSKAGGGELGLHGQVLSPEHWSQLFRFRQSMWREARIDYPQFDSEDVELSASIPALLGLSERAEFLLDYDYRGPPLAGIRRQEGLLSFPIQGSHGASEEADVPHRTGHGMTRCEFLLGRGQNNIKVTEKESCALRDIVIDRSTGCITFSQADGWRLQLRIRGPVKDGSAPTSASAQTST